MSEFGLAGWSSKSFGIRATTCAWAEAECWPLRPDGCGARRASRLFVGYFFDGAAAGQPTGTAELTARRLLARLSAELEAAMLALKQRVVGEPDRSSTVSSASAAPSRHETERGE